MDASLLLEDSSPLSQQPLNFSTRESAAVGCWVSNCSL